jgi:hypothetical protein
MDKKPYKKPEIKKVKLEVKNSVLAVCYSSTSGLEFPTCQDTFYDPCYERN